MPLYPEVSKVISYQFKVDSTHFIYVEECGNPEGLPIVFLHGGPGSGCNETHRRYFDPKVYRIILFDQRGCGRSTPYGCLENNTTQHLVDDMEHIRKELKITNWVLFAGSWGVALALLYAQQHEQCVAGMILRGAFLASQRDLDWFFTNGVPQLFPDLWENINTALPLQGDGETLLARYYRCLFDDNPELNKKAALAWAEWTDTVVCWSLPDATFTPPKDIKKLIKKVRLELHYATNLYFLQDNQLIDNIHQIESIPTVLIHGRQDITCPVESSWLLHRKFNNASLNILPNTGHLAGETSMIEALVSATNHMPAMIRQT